MSKVFAFMNLKGGVGKSVIGANIAREISAQVKKKVLIVDLDPQCSISNMLMDEDAFVDRPKENTTYEAIYSQLNNPRSLLVHDVVVVYVDRGALFNPPSGAEVHLLPGSTEIYHLIAAGGVAAAKLALQNFEAFIDEAKKNYEYIFLDTNPSTNIATLCALQVSDYIIAPITMDIFAVRGVVMLKSVFGSNHPALSNWERTVGIWNAIDPKYRRANQTSPAEQLLYKKNQDLVKFALTNRIYHSGYLNYKGNRRGFLHDASPVGAPAFFNRARRDLSTVCQEMMLRFGIAV